MHIITVAQPGPVFTRLELHERDKAEYALRVLRACDFACSLTQQSARIERAPAEEVRAQKLIALIDSLGASKETK